MHNGMVKCRSQPDINVGLSNVPETKIPRVTGEQSRKSQGSRRESRERIRSSLRTYDKTSSPSAPHPPTTHFLGGSLTLPLSLSLSYSRSFKFKRAKAIVTRQCRTSWHNRRNNKILDVVVVVIVRTAPSLEMCLEDQREQR